MWHADRPPPLHRMGSLPLGLTALTLLTTPVPGIRVVFPPPVSVAALLVTRGSLAPHIPLLQPVAALPGETVCVQDNRVLLQGNLVAPVALVDGLSRRLPRWRGDVILGAGEGFLWGPWTPVSCAGRACWTGRVARVLGRVLPVMMWGVWGATGGNGERGQDKGTAHTATLPLKNQHLGRHTSIFCVPRASNVVVLQWVARHTRGCYTGER